MITVISNQFQLDKDLCAKIIFKMFEVMGEFLQYIGKYLGNTNNKQYKQCKPYQTILRNLTYKIEIF